MDEIRVGVVGLGFGEHHVRTLVNLPGARLVAVADTEPARLHRIAGACGATPYADGTEMIRGERLGAVSLCVSPKFREPLLRAALEANVAAFVEKPWAADMRQARELQALCRSASAPVMVGFSFRFHPAIVRLRELLAGELGRPWMANAEYVFDWLPKAESWLWDPANGNGIFNENSCHLFDALCAVMGSPETLMAHAGTFVGRPSEEAAALSMRFSGGGLAAVTVGGIGASPFHHYPRIDVCTERGRAELRGVDHTWHSLEWGLRGSRDTSRLEAAPEALGATRYTAAFAHFLACIRDGRRPEASIDDGVRSVAIAEAVYRSARTGRPVEIEQP